MGKDKDISKVRLVVVKGNQILVLKKTDSDEMYSLIGGHVDKGEERKESLIREAYEEVRMTIIEEELVLLREEEGKKVMKYYYLLTDNSKHFEVVESHKFEDCIWVDIKDAVKEMESSDKDVLEYHLLEKM